VLRGAQFGFGAGNGGVGFDQVGRRIGGAADFAVVAVLVLGVALGALALDEAVRQEQLLDRVVILLDGADFDQAGGAQLQVDVVGAVAGFVGMGRVIVVETDPETGKVAGIFWKRTQMSVWMYSTR
jgi:hypothetical protein